MTTPIENTSQRDPLTHLAGAFVEGSSDYITGMEADGQRQLVNSDRLPTDITYSTREDFEALGFTFGDPDPDDPMFMPATLPEGWRREGSGHAMWSYIVDERRFRRVAIFYKAAFYDRSAHMNLISVGREVVSEHVYGQAVDGGVCPPIPWERLSEDERAEAVEALHRRRAEAVEAIEGGYGRDEHRGTITVCDAALAAVEAQA